MPATPRQWTIAIHISCVNRGTGIEEQLNRLFFSEGGGAMERCFCTGTGIAHEGAGINTSYGG